MSFLEALPPKLSLEGIDSFPKDLANKSKLRAGIIEIILFKLERHFEPKLTTSQKNFRNSVDQV